jgi:rare lipoprotein A
MDTLTAAHPNLPFNTRVRVLNLDNGRSVDVRVADRGPYVEGRIIDVSRAAATQIGLIESGTARVRVEVLQVADAAPVSPALIPVSFKAIPLPPPSFEATAGGQFGVQTGAFRNPDNAKRFAARMQALYGTARLEYSGESSIWRVVVGAEATREAAEALNAKIHENNAFVVRLIHSNDAKQPESPRSDPSGRTVAGDGLHPPVN